jgi:hypothetical protein
VPYSAPVLRQLLALAAVFLLGCTPAIGDACQTNVDCSRLGNRFCDTSAPDGYCTVDGCDTSTCPSNSVCIRFFTIELDNPCVFDAADPNDRSTCRADERCICDQNNDSGDCCILDSTGKNCVASGPGPAHCAPESSERRWCQADCNSNGDCRDGYECRRTGSLGSLSVPTLSFPIGVPENFCAPSGK